MPGPLTAAGRSARLWEASLVGVLLALAALAWVVTERLAAPHMRLGVLTGAGSFPDGTGSGPPLAALGLFLAIWTVMMAAMMLPAVVPVVVTVHRWARRTRRSSSTRTAVFVAGYLLVWGASGAVVYAGIAVLGPVLPTGDAAVRLGGAVLVAAGAYQLSPLKDVCLRQCRSPLGFVAAHASRLTRGGLAAARVGAVHGGFCLGCCWALMLVLVLVGMMSLTWMAVVAGVVLAEKVAPRGRVVARVTAMGLLGAGVVVALSAGTLPALA